MRLRPTSAAFTLLLGSLVTLASFATDMGLPVLAATAADLGVTPARAALVFSVFMAGFACGPLAGGPLSDRAGRRPVLLAGCAAFAVCGALGASSRSLGALLVWRFLMGAGAGTCQVLVLAMVRDLFAGAEARARQSYVNLASGVAPIVAPTLGVWVAAAGGGWRAIYGALGAGAAVLFVVAALCLGETAPRGAAAPRLTVRAVAASYARVLRHRVSVGYALVVALSFGSLFAYVTGSPLVVIGLMGVSPRSYGLLFASTAFGLMIGAFTNARLLRRGVAYRRLIGAGLATVTAVTLVLLALATAGWLRVWSLVPLVVVGHVGHGVLRPNAAQGALEPLPGIAGVASAVLSALQMVAGALASAAAAAFFDGRTPRAMTGTMAVCALGAAAAYVGVVRPAERRLGARWLDGGVRGDVRPAVAA
jgi:DHA1 family bicyclomycin/chloramphenicol resistance-like MFS transporter